MRFPVGRRGRLKLVTDGSVLDAWYEEAERRWGEIERGELETVPWDDVRKRVFGTP